MGVDADADPPPDVVVGPRYKDYLNLIKPY